MTQVKHTLIIRPGAIGDTLLTMPLLQTMQRQQAVSIHFVGHPFVLPLLHACHLIQQGSNYDDARWSFLFLPPHTASQRAARGLALLHQELHQCDRVIAWLSDTSGTVAENLRMAAVPHTIIAPGRPPAQSRQHITSYLANTLAQDCPAWQTWSAQESWRPPTPFSWQPIPSAQRPALALHPGSGAAHKCWPISAFARLIHMLWRDGIDIVLLSGPADTERVDQLQHILGQPPTPSALRSVQSRPLLYITHELLQCQGYIGNDTGMTHLAALLGVPTVALFGPTDPSTWHPIGPRVTLLHASTLADLSPQEVYTNIAYLRA